MGYLPNITAPEMATSSSGRHYHDLMELSALARTRGDHLAAQQFATAAHKWAMDEHVRLQILVQAEDALEAAARDLKAAWGQEGVHTSVGERREHQRETQRAVLAWERARDAARELAKPLTTNALSVS